MQVRAFDADGTDANNQVTYELGDPKDPFAIDSLTGNITTTVEFDREERSFYNIKVIATDNSESALIPGKHNSGQQVFRIEIADKNDNPPKFANPTYVSDALAENANINVLVTQIHAEDVDTGKLDIGDNFVCIYYEKILEVVFVLLLKSNEVNSFSVRRDIQHCRWKYRGCIRDQEFYRRN